MKNRKTTQAWIGIILCVVVAGIIFASPAVSNLFALLPAALFVPFVIMLGKSDSRTNNEDEDVDEDESEPMDWKLLICKLLVAIAAIFTIFVLIFFGWWSLIPAACLLGALIWMSALLEWHHAWKWAFIIALIVAIVLLGVYGIAISTGRVSNLSNHVDTMYVDNLIVEDATVATMSVEDMTVENETVANQDVENQTVTNQDVDNQIVENSTVTNQDVENQTVTNQVVENQTVTNQVVENQTVPTEPPATEPPVTEPTATEPPATEPPATEPPHTHKYTSVVTKPTCMTQGYTTHTCSCGHSYKDSYTGALGHDYKSTVVEPTTESGGYTEHKCTRCGHTYKDNFTDALPKPTEPEVTPTIKVPSTIRYGETVYVTLEGISASNLKVSNKRFVSVEILSDTRVAITLTEDVTGYITITDAVSGVNVVIDIV